MTAAFSQENPHDLHQYRVRGLGSKTTLVRILKNTAGERSILNLRNALVNCRELSLTAEELRKIDESLYTRKEETTHGLVYEELWAMLRNREAPLPEIRVTGESGFRDLYAFGRSIRNKDIECLIVNCAFRTFTENALRFLNAKEGGEISVSHYFYNSGYSRLSVKSARPVILCNTLTQRAGRRPSQDRPEDALP